MGWGGGESGVGGGGGVCVDPAAVYLNLPMSQHFLDS